ncbi:hypothetical protein [Nitrobacter sp.]|uniref:hypothetical protein n=1 Tax=Nitrobacter sp. TaxID=29420 RepID=UPI00399D5966
MSIVFPRFASNAIVDMAKGCGAAQATTARGRDKKPHIAARSGGCCDYDFWSFAHIAETAREVRAANLSNAFNEYCTSRYWP